MMRTTHTPDQFDNAHDALLAGDWHRARRALEALVASADHVDLLPALDAYPAVSAMPAYLRAPLADRIRAANAAAERVQARVAAANRATIAAIDAAHFCTWHSVGKGRWETDCGVYVAHASATDPTSVYVSVRDAYTGGLVTEAEADTLENALVEVSAELFA